MPTDYRDMDSRDQFGMCIGELGCHIECVRVNTNYFGVIADFNANCYGSIFFSELMEFCSENGLTVSDMWFLGPTDYTCQCCTWDHLLVGSLSLQSQPAFSHLHNNNAL